MSIMHFESVADDYAGAEHEGFYKRIAAELCDLLSVPDRPLRILDVGCGAGYSTEVLTERFPGAGVAAVEPSPSMADHARARLASAITIHPSLDHLDASSFELVFSSMSFHWLSEPDRDRLLELLARDALLAIAAPGRLAGDRSDGNQLVYDAARRSVLSGDTPRRSRAVEDLSLRSRYPELKEVASRRLSLVESLKIDRASSVIGTRGVYAALFDSEEARDDLSDHLDAALGRLERDEIPFAWPISLWVASTKG